MRSVRLLVWLLLLPAALFALNPTPSLWMKNLSEPSTEVDQLTKYKDYAPEIAISGNTVHVLWLTSERPEGGTAVEALYYRRSTNGGQTFEKKVRLYAKNDLEGNYGLSDKLMAVDGQNVYIAFSMFGAAGPNPPRTTWFGRVGYFHSTDGGLTFAPMQILHDAPDAWADYHVYVSADAGKATIGFQTQCNWCVDNTFVVLDSFDNGATFKSRPAFTITGTGSGWHAWDMKRVGNAVYVLYTDAAYSYGLVYSNLYVAAAVDGGTFKSTKISVPSKNGNDKAFNLQGDDYTPKLAGWQGNVHATWQGLDANDQQQIFAARSTNSGATWEKPIALTQTLPAGSTYIGAETSIEAKGAYVNVALTLQGYKIYKVYTCQSADNGFSFGPPQLLTGTGYWQDSGYWARLALDPSDDSGRKIQAHDDGRVHSSTNGGLMFSPPMWLTPASWSWDGYWRPRVAVSADGGIHWLAEGILSGGSDNDIFYCRLDPAPAASTRGALQLISDTSGKQRYDTMQVRPSSDINFTNTMTAEIWVWPVGLGNVASGSFTPIFHKRETWDPVATPYVLGTIDGNGGRMPVALITTTEGTYWLGPGTYKVTIPNSRYSHLAFTYDANASGNNFKLYVNGQLVGSTAAKGALKTGDGSLFLGYYGSWVVDEFRLWSKVQSASDILALKDKPLTGKETGLAAYWNFDNTTKDITGHGNDGVLLYREIYQVDVSAGNPLFSVTAITNAASYAAGPAAPGSIVTVWGGKFTDSKDGYYADRVPLPITLGKNIAAKITDSNGKSDYAPLFAAFSSQINMAIPAGMAEGPAQMFIYPDAGNAFTYWFDIANVTPGLFTASGGVAPAGYAILAAANGSQTTQNWFDANLVVQRLNFGKTGDKLYIELFGTGLRLAKTAACTIGGVSVPVTVVAQSQFVGLDQVSIGPVPATLAGTGTKDIVVTLDGKKANTVTLLF